MNKDQRKAIDEILELVSDVRMHIGIVQENEQASLDELPESLQDAGPGEQINEAIDALEEALTAIDEVEDALERAKV